MEDSQQPSQLNPALEALDVMVGVWELKGRDLTTNEEIRGWSSFEWLAGGFFLCHQFTSAYAGRRIRAGSAKTAIPSPAGGSGQEGDTRGP